MESEIVRVRTGTRDAEADITIECAESARSASRGGDGLLHVNVDTAARQVRLSFLPG